MSSKNLIAKKKSVAALGAMLVLLEADKKRKRKVWVKQYLKRRKEQGIYDNLFRELYLEDEESFRSYIRISTSAFEFLLERVSPLIEKKDTVMRSAIPSAAKLATTLRYLATGETQTSLHFQFRISQSAISLFIPAVCDAICVALSDYFEVPSTAEDWKKVADGFGTVWNFPMCIGAMDGKHVKILPPPGSGSTYFNYKGEFSIVLLALVNANLEFLYVDIGTNGRISDGGVWAKSDLRRALDSNHLNLPEANKLPGTSVVVPYVIVADDAFPLTMNIMKPYPGRCLDKDKRMFSYRLSGARRVSENAFGLLASRFRLYYTQMATEPERAETIVRATCCLHNFLRRRRESDNTAGEAEEGSSSNLLPIADFLGNSRSNTFAKQIRDKYCSYFNGTGAVPWQDSLCDTH